MFAYRLPAANDPFTAAEHPSAKRLLVAGPWQYQAHPMGGVLMAPKREDGKSWALDDFAAPLETADGLLFYAPKAQPQPADFAKAVVNAVTVELRSGVRLNVALAAASPRKLIFSPSGISTGDYLTEYARMAEELRQRALKDEVIHDDDPTAGKIVLLGIQQCYRVTEELLTFLGWVSTADFLPILMAAWGYDPKAASAGSGT